MEHTLIAAYVAMLIGYLIIDNEVSVKNFEFWSVPLSKPVCALNQIRQSQYKIRLNTH